MNGVVVDLSPHPEVSFAVVLDGQLLPARFRTEAQAYEHLGQLVAVRDGRPFDQQDVVEGEAA